MRAFVAPDDNAASAVATMSGVWQISTEGGVHPVWSPNGRELHYLDPVGTMMATPVTITGDTIEAGNPIALFPANIYGGGTDAGVARQYDIASDGRFLINTLIDRGSTAPITLIQNWNPEAVQ